MRPWIIIVGLAFISTGFLMQPASAQVPGTGDLSGQVCIVWGECEPLPDASVVVTGGLLGAVEREATTDEAGRFHFEALPHGDYGIVLERAGFATVEEEVTVARDTEVMLETVGQEVAVSGQVLDASGNPLAKAWIRLHGPQWHDASTDAEGRFQVRLVAGWYEVAVEAARHGSASQRMLMDGSDVVVELVPPPGQEALIRGRVLDQGGQAVAGADVRVDQYEAIHSDGRRSHGGHSNWTRTGDDGRYEVHVYGGGVSMSFSKEGHSHEYQWVELGAQEARTVDIELLRYPEKTARIQGQVRDAAGGGLRDVGISLQHPEYGLWECSTRGGGTSASASGAEPAPDMASDDMAYSTPGHDGGCAITIHADGTFTGNVTPGYAILQVHYDRWSACDETHHADGSSQRNCGPDYYSHSRTLDLEAGADNAVDVVLKQRPGPDAAINGYVLDKETQQAVPRAHVSFGHQDSWSRGSATTDGDGSYKVRVRSGLHEVNVWVEGYLPWQGTVEVDGETPLDIVLTPGEARHGGCCYGYADAHAEDAPRAAGSGSADVASDVASGSSENGDDFEDLGGGLGPYDAAKRAKVLEEPAKKSTPAPLVAAVLALALVATRRR